MTLPPDLSARLAALPLDRAPLRRAGLLAVLLVVLLVAGRAFGPQRPAPAPRNDVQGSAEASSARPAPAPSAWTGGRVLAVALLAAGGVGALVLRTRRPAAPSARRLDVLETQPLGAAPALQLVACADEVLLVSVAPDGARVLRTWPRDRFDGAPALAASPDAPAASVPLVVPRAPVALGTGVPPVYPTFAEALAEASAPQEPGAQLAPPPRTAPVPEGDCAEPAFANQAASPLPVGEGQGEGSDVVTAAPTVAPARTVPEAGVVASPLVAAPVAERFLTGLPQFGAAHA